MTNQEIIDGLERIRFFNQRAGRELWNDKDKNVQDIDIQSADEILSEAIKALEELPKRRKEAKRWRAKAHQIADESYKECEYLKSAIRISKNIPKEMAEKVFFDTQEKEINEDDSRHREKNTT